MPTLWHSRVSAVLGLAFVLVPLHAQAAGELDQHLSYQYDDKTLVLRNFYHGERLSYDSGGSPIGSSVIPGDWTVDGFIRVTALSLHGQHLTIQAERLFFGNSGQSFQLKKEPKKEKKLRIEVEFDAGDITAEKADAVLSRIFLTAQDRFVDFVPPYWKPCILATSKGNSERQYNACRFPPEFALVPGILSSVEESPEPKPTTANSGSGGGIVLIGKGISPPRVVSQVDPEFSKEARRAKYQGTILVSLIVNKSGEPRDIRIVRPLGLGLDQEAVETIAKWRFDPARKNGEAVEVEIMVQVDFHLY